MSPSQKFIQKHRNGKTIVLLSRLSNFPFSVQETGVPMTTFSFWIYVDVEIES
jgi:hypothetical protein